jgi:hypothetical protein
LATAKQQAGTRSAGSKAQRAAASKINSGKPSFAPTKAQSVEELTQELTAALLADSYLADLVYDALLEIGEASKVSEITLEINNPRVTFPVVRRILNESPRFLSVERLWTLSARYLDISRPTDRNLQEVLEAAGKPLSTAEMATELSAIYNRPSDVYIQLLAKTVQNKTKYFKTTRGLYGLMSWLPLVDAEEEADVLFDNRLNRGLLAPFLAPSEGVKWTAAGSGYADATVAVLNAIGERPVPHHVLGVLAWMQLTDKYDPLAHLVNCFADPRLVWLTSRAGGRWITRAHADKLEAILEERSASMAGEDTDESAPVEVATPVVLVPTPQASATSVAEVVAAPVAEPVASQPLQVTEDDLRAIQQIILDRGSAVEATELLALQYEVVAGDTSYRSDVETLEEKLKSDDRFLYVGAGRFREPNSLPLFVYDIPEFLSFPDLQFVSLDGEIMDEEIQDEGYVGTLRHDVLQPLAQDVGDDEGHYTGEESSDSNAVRLVVKSHHKDIGTFPLCQIPDGFFPNDATVVEIVVRDPSGATHDIIVNNEIRLAFNLFGLYEFLEADSGATFLLHKTARPYEYRFEAAPENDRRVYIASARMSELMGLREQADDGGDMATFDIVCEVLAHYPKGLDFVEAITEVNVVRRVTRRKIASILSNYYCFVQKAGQEQWRFDAKKRDLGTDRAKRQYLKR